jgi:polyhydroxyalkanoate synthase
VLNVFAEEDHIIPPKSTQALKSLIGTKDYTELPLPGGHVGVFVSGKSQGILGKNIYAWLKSHS